MAESLLTKIIKHCHSVVIVRLASSVVSVSSLQFVLMCYHSISRKEEFLFLSALINSVFSVSQADLTFVSSVAQTVAKFHFETKSNQAAILQLAQEKLVVIRNEAEEKRQYVLCGQALILQELIQSLQTKKPLQLP